MRRSRAGSTGWGRPRVPLRLDSRQPGFEVEFTSLLSAKRETQEDVAATVAAVIADVRRRGDAAIIDYTRRWDRLELRAGALALSPVDITAARARCAPALLDALELAAVRIEDFHR